MHSQTDLSTALIGRIWSSQAVPSSRASSPLPLLVARPISKLLWVFFQCSGILLISGRILFVFAEDLYTESDIDIFLYGVTPGEANAKLAHLYKVIFEPS